MRRSSEALAFLLLLAFGVFADFMHSGCWATPGGLNRADSSSFFLVKPYLQFGDSQRLTGNKVDMELVWFAETEQSDWKAQWHEDKPVASANPKEKSAGDAPSANEALIVENKRMGLCGGKPFFRITAKLSGVKAGQSFTYSILQGDKVVFTANGKARKAFDQPYRIALAGDIGAGSPGEKRVAFEINKMKPDLFIVPGDIVYPFGRVSEYLNKFFPILNCDEDSPQAGAPLLRSTPTIAVIGNHDVAMTNTWNGTNVSAFPDALGYYIFWSEPLNGPIQLPNSPNTPYLSGDQENQLSFVRAAGKRYPAMANFSFDYGNAHWLVLDANPYMDWTDKELRAWVEKDLHSADKCTWKFVCYHQPAFSADVSHYQEQRMRLICDILEKEKVDLVFSGHAHDYQRTYPLRFKSSAVSAHAVPVMEVPGTCALDKKFDGQKVTRPNGIIYIVTGGGGAKLYPQSNDNEVRKNVCKFAEEYSFTILDTNGPTLTLTQYSDTGKVIDQIKIEKR